MEERVREELEHVLAWARFVRQRMEEAQEERDDLQMQGHAYVGGVLTTLDHLGFLTEAEHVEWSDRLTEVLGDPPGGWVAG